MSAYIIVKITVEDSLLLKPYQNVAPDIVTKYDGVFLARGGDSITLEGKEENKRTIILEFPTLAKAKEFYDSKEYQEAIELRKNIATFEMIAIEGI